MNFTCVVLIFLEGVSYQTVAPLFSGVFGKVQLHSAYPKKS